MSLFNRIGSWFKGLFSNFGTTVQEILHGISSAVNLAVPLVTELSGIAAANPTGSALITDIEKWLGKFETDATAVQTWTTSVAGLSTAAILQSAASFALKALVPAGVLQSDINLAIELAYAIFKRTAPTGTPVI
jgi:hypothetical protein